MRPAPLNDSMSSSSSQQGFPIPVGVDESRPLREMKANSAIRIINGVGHPDGIRSRGGSRALTRIPGAADSLLHWSDEKLFTAGPAGIYETMANSVTPSVTVGVTVGRWQGCNLSNPAGVFLVAANGFDGVRSYDGRTWRNAPMTGADRPERLANPTWHNRRVWFYERGSLDLWYLPPSQFCGEVQVFPLAGVFNKGGEITGIMSLASDDADNMNAQLVVCTSKGQVAVYQGHDPARSETFSKAGQWDTYPTVGFRPLGRVGGQAVMLTTAGLVGVPNALTRSKIEEDDAFISNPIRQTMARQALFPHDPAWQVFETRAENGAVIINRPDRNQSILTSGWSELRELSASAWIECGENTYFCQPDGTVKLYGFGHTDDGAAISGEVVHAYSRLGSSRLKHVTRIRPDLVSVPLNPRFKMLADHAMPADRYPATAVAEGGVTWDINERFTWNNPQEQRRYGWRTTSGRGHALALVFSWASKGPLLYNGCDVQISNGGAN